MNPARSRTAATVGVLLLTLMALVPAAAGVDDETMIRPANEKPLTTYERFLPLAVAGDRDIQYFLGYMFFYGEGVEQNYDEAHHWFHLAAEEGDARAQRNLGIFHSRAIARIPRRYFDPDEANLWFSLLAANPENPQATPVAARSYARFLQPDLARLERSQSRFRGRNIYFAACAGCHGFDGHAAHPAAPSFAARERLERTDAELVAAILDGKGEMPAWRDRLTLATVRDVVAFIRTGFDRAGGAAAAPAPALDSAQRQQLALGENIYARFCGGCHGFNGIAWYVNSPSFALRERLHKSDAELVHSITHGRGAMPSWEYLLKPHQIEALVKFVRTLAPTYEAGILGELRRPEQYLRFRPGGETGQNWTGDDFR